MSRPDPGPSHEDHPRGAPDPRDARTPPTRPDERGTSADDEARARREAADASSGAPGDQGSRGTSAASPEEIAGRPGTTQHVPADGVPPGAERSDPTQGGGRSG